MKASCKSDFRHGCCFRLFVIPWWTAIASIINTCIPPWMYLKLLSLHLVLDEILWHAFVCWDVQWSISSTQWSWNRRKLIKANYQFQFWDQFWSTLLDYPMSHLLRSSLSSLNFTTVHGICRSKGVFSLTNLKTFQLHFLHQIPDWNRYANIYPIYRYINNTNSNVIN